jgi:transglutaminase-like putative cysteine protease
MNDFARTGQDRAISIKALLGINTAACILTAFVPCANFMSMAHVWAFTALFLSAVALDAFGSRRPNRIIINLVAIGAMLSAMRAIRLSSIIETFTEAILILIAVKMLEEKKPNDYLQVLCLSVLALLSAAVLSIGVSAVYFCFLMSILSGFEFILITWFAKDPKTTVSPERFLQLFCAALAIWITMLPICLVLFFIAPRARTAMVQFKNNDPRSFTGFSDQITLGTMKSIQMSEEISFRAEAPILPPNSLYWRGLTMDIFNGQTWYSTRRGFSDRAIAADGKRVIQKILLEPGYHRTFFALDMPTEVNSENALPMGDGLFLNTNARFIGRLNYTAVSYVSSNMRTIARSVNDKLYLNLPPDYIPKLRQITDDLTRHLSSAQKIQAIKNYLAPPTFEYTLDDLPVSRNALEAFIFSHQKGNCEFFASAMAVMLRMAGVPARLVAGYHGGVYNSSGGYYIVNQSDAHVWVEAWDEETLEWVRSDPTPASASLNLSDGGHSYTFLSLYADMLNYRLSSLFIEYDRQSQYELLSKLRSILDNPKEIISRGADDLFESLGKLAWPLAIVSVVILFSAMAVKAIFKMKKPEDALLGDFLSAMERRGYKKNISDGLEEFVMSVKKSGDERLAGLALSFVLVFEKFYFKDVPLDTLSAAKLRDMLKQIKMSG